MALQVCAGATLRCSFGITPSILAVEPIHQVYTETPDANIMDHIPLENILPFGMCTAPTNPAVEAATAAALGVPTPAPCIPETPAPWVTGAPTVLIAETPSLDSTAKLMCTWLGVITIINPGQETVFIP